MTFTVGTHEVKYPVQEYTLIINVIMSIALTIVTATRSQSCGVGALNECSATSMSAPHSV